MFITHDLATVRAIADDVVVMHRGEVVRQGEEPVFHTAFPRPCLQLVYVPLAASSISSATKLRNRSSDLSPMFPTSFATIPRADTETPPLT